MYSTVPYEYCSDYESTSTVPASVLPYYCNTTRVNSDRALLVFAFAFAFAYVSVFVSLSLSLSLLTLCGSIKEW